MRRRAPVDGEQAPPGMSVRSIAFGRLERGVVEVVEDLGARRSGRTRRPGTPRGSRAARTSTSGTRARGAARARSRRRRSPAGRRTWPASRCGEHADRAADLQRRWRSGGRRARRSSRRTSPPRTRWSRSPTGPGRARRARRRTRGPVVRSRSLARRLDPLAAQPGDERIEPVLEHEQLEVAARAVERRAGRERARAGRARGLVEDRRARVGDRRAQLDRDRREVGFGWLAAACSNQRSIVACAVTIRPAASARRSSVSGLAARSLERRLGRRVERSPPTRRRADRVAAELRLADQRAERAR